jgi:hypothetical protein
LGFLVEVISPGGLLLGLTLKKQRFGKDKGWRNITRYQARCLPAPVA